MHVGLLDKSTLAHPQHPVIIARPTTLLISSTSTYVTSTSSCFTHQFLVTSINLYSAIPKPSPSSIPSICHQESRRLVRCANLAWSWSEFFPAISPFSLTFHALPPHLQLLQFLPHFKLFYSTTNFFSSYPLLISSPFLLFSSHLRRLPTLLPRTIGRHITSCGLCFHPAHHRCAFLVSCASWSYIPSMSCLAFFLSLSAIYSHYPLYLFFFSSFNSLLLLSIILQSLGPAHHLLVGMAFARPLGGPLF